MMKKIDYTDQTMLRKIDYADQTSALQVSSNAIELPNKT